eukprot:COSAG05_NODE_7379_length_820_cov_0.479889_2_plen_85_part_01
MGDPGIELWRPCAVAVVAVRVGLPETWSVLAHGWRTHGLPAGSLTPLQASMVRLAWAGLLLAGGGVMTVADLVGEIGCDESRGNG